ncbi:peptidoglycan-binding protein [Candidatus Wolfebacteria bacterium]|nr:peptidoglycan-binding protein [Candidatus Wolfebacteria bacterium]
MVYYSQVSRRSTLLSLGTLVVIMVLPMIGSAQTALFPRNLGVGSQGSDVILLQRTLNQDPTTRVSASGPGSPGSETAYFGAQTEAAVRRFQSKYADTVLAPIGLSAPTGYVGSNTRMELERLYEGGQSFVKDTTPSISNLPALIQEVTQRSTPTQPPSLYQQTDPHTLPVKVFSVTPTSGGEGTEVTLHGQGFLEEGNSVHAGFAFLTDIPSPDGKRITFTVESPFPNDLIFPEEVRQLVPNLGYGFAVENTNGKSNIVQFMFIPNIQ